MINGRRTVAAGLAALSTLLAASGALADDPVACNRARASVPATVSPAAAAQMRAMAAMIASQPIAAAKPPSTPAEWAAAKPAMEKMSTGFSQPTIDRLKPQVREDRLGGVGVLWVMKASATPSRRLLIYVHGGGYTWFSARSSLSAAALMADAAGLTVVSVDYTTAPQGDWRRATDQVLAVYKALLAKGYAASSIGLYGDSAGGGLIGGSVLKMRDLGVVLPGALVMQSPWSDITDTGDTYATLACADPILDAASLKAGADAYAAPADQRNPYVSPVYGDYAKAFPPTLIQGGTREIFLSNFVRQYQAIRGGGHEAILDLYEGMPHVFMNLFPDTPEAQTAFARAATFWREHLTER